MVFPYDFFFALSCVSFRWMHINISLQTLDFPSIVFETHSNHPSSPRNDNKIHIFRIKIRKRKLISIQQQPKNHFEHICMWLYVFDSNETGGRPIQSSWFIYLYVFTCFTFQLYVYLWTQVSLSSDWFIITVYHLNLYVFSLGYVISIRKYVLLYLAFPFPAMSFVSTPNQVVAHINPPSIITHTSTDTSGISQSRSICCYAIYSIYVVWERQLFNSSICKPNTQIFNLNIID